MDFLSYLSVQSYISLTKTAHHVSKYFSQFLPLSELNIFSLTLFSTTLSVVQAYIIKHSCIAFFKQETDKILYFDMNLLLQVHSHQNQT